MRLDLALVACGAKPACLESVMVDANGHYRVGFGNAWWDPTPLLDAMRAAGFVVASRPHHLGRGQAVLSVARSSRRAERVLDLNLAGWLEEQGDFATSRATLRLGALLGYPRSGGLAYVGHLPRSGELPVTAIDRPFRFGVVADTPEGMADAVRVIEQNGRSFRAAYGDDLYREEDPRLIAPRWVERRGQVTNRAWRTSGRPYVL